MRRGLLLGVGERAEFGLEYFLNDTHRGERRRAPQYALQWITDSTISVRVKPFRTAPRTWPRSSFSARSAMSMPRLSRLRLRRSSPGRDHTAPQACSVTNS